MVLVKITVNITILALKIKIFDYMFYRKNTLHSINTVVSYFTDPDECRATNQTHYRRDHERT